MHRHQPIEFPQGDTLQIEGTLFSFDGSPLDLTNATIEWVLFDSMRNTVNASPTITTVADPVSGVLSIILPASISQDIAVGSYLDQLRVTIEGVVTTMWEGAVRVTYSAFSSPP